MSPSHDIEMSLENAPVVLEFAAHLFLDKLCMISINNLSNC